LVRVRARARARARVRARARARVRVLAGGLVPREEDARRGARTQLLLPLQVPG